MSRVASDVVQKCFDNASTVFSCCRWLPRVCVRVLASRGKCICPVKPLAPWAYCRVPTQCVVKHDRSLLWILMTYRNALTMLQLSSHVINGCPGCVCACWQAGASAWALSNHLPRGLIVVYPHNAWSSMTEVRSGFRWCKEML